MRFLSSPPLILLVGLATSFVAHRLQNPGGRPPLIIHTLRWLLGLIFLLSGLSKLLPGYPNVIGPPWLEERLAPFDLALFARYVAFSEATVGALLFTRRFATLGALMLVPMLSSILMVTISLAWRGTPFVVTLLLLFTGVLLAYDYPRLRWLVEDSREIPALPPSGPRHRSDLLWLVGLGALVGLALLPAVRESVWAPPGLSLAICGLIAIEWRRSSPGAI